MPIPLLQLLFSPDSTQDIRADFIINQAVDTILLCETIDASKSVFIYPLYQITGYTNIECPVSLAGEDVNTGLFHLSGLDSRLRGNDGEEETDYQPRQA